MGIRAATLKSEEGYVSLIICLLVTLLYSRYRYSKRSEVEAFVVYKCIYCSVLRPEVPSVFTMCDNADNNAGAERGIGRGRGSSVEVHGEDKLLRKIRVERQAAN